MENMTIASPGCSNYGSHAPWCVPELCEETETEYGYYFKQNYWQSGYSACVVTVKILI